MNTGLLIDTLSIQQYIFGSNKLKENIGASYIIENLVYKSLIPKTLTVLGIHPDPENNDWIEHWTKHPNLYRLKENPHEKVEIGFMGGGNAFLIFKDKSDAINFIKNFSKALLEHFPGLKTAYGLHDGFNDQQGVSYGQFMRELNSNLLKSRNFHAASVIPFKHGIVEDCPWTNEAQEIKNAKDGNIISSMADSRIKLVKEANENLTKKFSDQLGDDFVFTDNIDKFGQPDDKGYIAVVHADGNGLGQRFIACNNLEETRKFSAGVVQYADEVMARLISYLVGLFGDGGAIKEWKLDEDENGRRILPTRPLIIGGDDITFVCEGRLGVHLAEKLLHFMSSTEIEGENIAACAGIAIVHTHYPFYKAYVLAEELTNRAKEKSRDNEFSWMEYMISNSGFSGTVDDIVTQQYTINPNKELKNGPYQIDGANPNIQLLKSGMKIFNSDWPRSKVKDLRDALRRDEAYQNYFLKEIEARGLKLPGQSNGLWCSDSTPFFDMIELIDFYPQELL